MRLLHVITALDRGGAENHLVELVSEQRRLGADVIIVYLQGDGYWCHTMETKKVKCLHLKGSSKNPFKLLKASFKLASLIRIWNPDVIHAHLPPAELTAYFALLISLSSSSLVISKHLDGSFFSGSYQRSETWLGSIVGSLIINRSKAVICISKAVINYVNSSYRYKNHENKVKLIYYGIDCVPFEVAKVASSLNYSGQIFTLGTVARLVPQKSIETLLYAFLTFKSNASSPVRLRIAGDGPLRAKLQNLAIDLGINQDVEWCGKIENVPAFMASLDVFSLTSLYEGLGLVMLEAMAAGLPVVASSISAIPEIVVNNQTGLLVPPGDHVAFSNAFFRLYSDPHYRQSLGISGHERLVTYFSIQKMTQQTLAAYR